MYLVNNDLKLKSLFYLNMSEFISTWILKRNGNYSITLPLIPTGTYDFYIDWGDGSEKEHIISHCACHKYTSRTPKENIGYSKNETITKGILKYEYNLHKSIGSWFPTYTLKITGTIIGWSSNDSDYLNHAILRDISQWGCLKLGNGGAYFKNNEFLQISAKDAPDLSETTNLDYMFLDCTLFNSPISHWDVSHITSMWGMFTGARDFNQSLNNWNISNVKTCWGIFHHTESFDISNIMTWKDKNNYIYNQSLDSLYFNMRGLDMSSNPINLIQF
jgi:surface protein